MAGESRSLGKGLGALLGSNLAVSPSRGAGTLPITLMQPGTFQPRHAIAPESLQELAASIKASGVIQPIVVRRLVNEAASGARYEIIAGERRWQAAKLAGLADIPTIVRELSDKEALAIALIENIQREELTATDEARALRRLITEFSLTQQAVADSVGRSRVAVSNLMRLLELPSSVIEMIDSKALGMGHARALLALDEPEERERVAHLIVSRQLTVRETEKLVREVAQRPSVAPHRKPPDLLVTDVFKTPSVHVRLHQRPTGGGKIIIEFTDAHSRDELLALIRSFQGEG